MRVDTYKQLVAIKSGDPNEFQSQFNEKMKSLSAKKNVEPIISMDGGTFSAVILYEETERAMDSVADLFHKENIRYVCKQCPHMVDPKRGNVKWCECPFAELGTTHKDHECCELFYKELLQGKIKPLPDYVR